MKNLFYALIIVIFTSCYGELADSISEDIRLEEKIESLSNLVTQQNNRISGLLSTLDDLQSQVSNNNSVIDSLTTISQNSLSRIDSLDSALLLNLSRIDSLNKSLDVILSELLQNTTSLDSILSAQNDDSELSNILSTIDSLSNEIDTLQGELSNLASNSTSSNNESLIYFENGICKCPNALPNHSEIVDGVRYFVVDNVTVYDYVNLGRTNLCTTLVTNMDELFQMVDQYNEDLMGLGYNIDISFWDTSNVHSMKNMFLNYSKGFSSSLNNWDVSKVRVMEAMFRGSSFNQNISNWDVSSVTHCYRFDFEATSWTLPKPNFTNCTP